MSDGTGTKGDDELDSDPELLWILVVS
jgi:hypothetical protein